MKSVDVADDGLTGTDIDESTLNVSGAQGPKGATGPQGPAGADGSPDTAAQVLAKLLGVDGSGSNLDADKLDGLSSDAFSAVGHTHSAADLNTQMGVMTGRVNNINAAGIPPVFAAASGIGDATATEATITTLSPNVATVASGLSVKVTAAPGVGEARQFTLKVNGTETAVDCFVDQLATSCNSGTVTAVVPPGSELSLKVNGSLAPAPASALFGWRLR